jgi:hypothetical protein
LVLGHIHARLGVHRSEVNVNSANGQKLIVEVDEQIHFDINRFLMPKSLSQRLIKPSRPNRLTVQLILMKAVRSFSSPNWLL